MDDSTLKLIGIIIAGFAAIGGALFAYKRIRSKNYKNTQSNISINGNDNKVIGGDDKSKISTKK